MFSFVSVVDREQVAKNLDGLCIGYASKCCVSRAPVATGADDLATGYTDATSTDETSL